MSFGRRSSDSGRGSTPVSGRFRSPSPKRGLTRGPPSGRSSARSTDSEVSDILSVSGVGTKNDAKQKRHARSNSSRGSLVTGNGAKPKLTGSLNVPSKTLSTGPKKSSGQPKLKSGNRPAWALKPPSIPLEDDTPRSDISQNTYSLPPRPSVDDFLDFTSKTDSSPHNDGNSKSSSHDDAIRKLEENEIASRKTLLELLTADSARSSAFSPFAEHGHTDKSKNTSDFRRYDAFDSDEQIVSWNTSLKQNPHSNQPEPAGMSVSQPELGSSQSFKSTGFQKQENVANKTASSSKSRLRNQVQRPLEKNKIDRPKDLEGLNLDGIDEMSLHYKTDDYLIAKREHAAKTIQLWYRRIKMRKTAGAAAMKRMMASKREQLETRLSLERQEEHEKQIEEYEQMRRREEKARQARQEAINDMQTRREGKKSVATTGPKGSLLYMQKNGNVTKTKATAKKKRTTKITSGSEVSSESTAEVAEDDARKTPSPRPGTASSIGRKLDEIFEASSVGRSVTASTLASARSEDTTTSTLIPAAVKSSKTTFDDLMDTLKELEEEPPELKLVSGNASQVWGKTNDGDRTRFLSTSDLQKHNGGSSERQPGALLSADKLRSIMDFLDEVEKVEDDVRSEVSKSREMLKSVQVYTEEEAPERDLALESASQVASDISNAIAAQKSEIDQKQKTVDMMKKSMQQQKEFTTMQLKEMDKEHKQQLAVQRQDYEATIQRHLSFIDQLIEDKKVLSQRCEDLVSKLKETDAKYSSKIKQMEDSHALEIKRQKEVMEAAEKLRREKWVQEKTQQIKEMTVKGLEPDIQKLIAKHKAEIKKLKAMKQGEVLEADERVGRRYVQQIEDLRTQYEQEKETAVQRERDVARQRYEKQLEQEEESYQQQRRRMYAEIQQEKERLAEQAQKMRHEIDEERAAFEGTQKQVSVKLQEEHQNQVAEIERRHDVDMKNLKEQVEIEKQQWIENYMKKQDTYLLTKERELKEGVREARDKEIEMVIARLEQETAHNREEAERTAENRIRRIREKYENEIKELERSERHVQEKYNEMKEKLNDLENELLRLKSQVKLKEQELLDTKKLTDRLQEERGKVTDVIRQEFADRGCLPFLHTMKSQKLQQRGVEYMISGYASLCCRLQHSNLRSNPLPIQCGLHEMLHLQENESSESADYTRKELCGNALIDILTIFNAFAESRRRISPQANLISDALPLMGG